MSAHEHEHIFTKGIRRSVGIFAGVWMVGAAVALLDGSTAADTATTRQTTSTTGEESQYEVREQTAPQSANTNDRKAGKVLTGALGLGGIVVLSEYVVARRRRLLHDADGNYLDGSHDEAPLDQEPYNERFDEIIKDF